MQDRTLWLHIEPNARARTLLTTTRVPSKGEKPEATQAHRTLALLADIVDRLDTFAVAEVDLVDSDNDVEDAGLFGYELGIYLDQLANEERLDPAEMFGAVYLLLTHLDESGLFDVELTLEDKETTLEDMLEHIPQLAEDAGYYVGPETKLEDAPAPVETTQPLGQAELFFLQETKLTWPCSELQLKRQWKILAARFHPDRDPDAAEKFRKARAGYEALRRML